MNERLHIASGKLGPVPACTLDFRPFTVLLGAQGTGKSLVAQMLYFFKDLGRLLQNAARKPLAEGAAHDKRLEELLTRALDELRSPYRRFAVFADPKVTLGFDSGGLTSAKRQLPSINLQSVTRRARPTKALLSLASEALQSASTTEQAIFIPTERLLYSQLAEPAALSALMVPSTFALFAAWMARAGRVMEDWPDGQPDTPEGRWIWQRGGSILHGEAFRYAKVWKWRDLASPNKAFDIDMASSGQRANWPLLAIAAVLFSLRRRGELAEGFTLFVEEPEIHLHPQAQTLLVEVLAFLVNHGFRVVVTTHSLVSVYTLNNLLRASLLGERNGDGLPSPELRLQAEEVAVYSFVSGEVPVSLLDRTQSFVDEAALGRVSDRLGGELNRIEAMILSTRGA